MYGSVSVRVCCVCVCADAHVWMHGSEQMCGSACVYGQACISMCTHLSVWVCMCMPVSVHVRTHKLSFALKKCSVYSVTPLSDTKILS